MNPGCTVATMGVGLTSRRSPRSWRWARPALTVAAALSLAAAGSAVASAAGAKVSAKDRFAGRIVGAKGSFAGDRGTVVILLVPGANSTVTVALSGHRCATTRHCLRLSGTATGTITERQSIPDVGRTFTIRASGIVTPLGATAQSGTGHGTGFILYGHEQLQLRLSAASGTVTIDAQTGRVPGFTSP
jgi:hypothetical protein